MNQNNPSVRHSSAGRNPARTNIPRSGQNEPLAASFEERPNRDAVLLRRIFFNQLDSGLRRDVLTDYPE